MIDRKQRGKFRIYEIDGKKYISVTSVLSLLSKDGLLEWAVFKTVEFIKKAPKVTAEVLADAIHYHKRFLNATADEGTEDHNNIEDYLKGKPVKEDCTIKAFKRFEREYCFVFEAAEQVVYSDVKKVAGSIDLIGTIHSHPAIIDLKTSKQIYLSHKIQVCAYRDLYCAMRGINPNDMKVGILCIPRGTSNTLVHFLTPEEEKYCRKIFNNLIENFFYLKALGEIKLT